MLRRGRGKVPGDFRCGGAAALGAGRGLAPRALGRGKPHARAGLVPCAPLRVAVGQVGRPPLHEQFLVVADPDSQLPESRFPLSIRPVASLKNIPQLDNRDRVVSAVPVEDDSSFELKLRPQRLDEFIGQAKVKENLAVAIEAAKSRGEALDHVLLYGPPGLGKTTLATSSPTKSALRSSRLPARRYKSRAT